MRNDQDARRINQLKESLISGDCTELETLLHAAVALERKVSSENIVPLDKRDASRDYGTAHINEPLTAAIFSELLRRHNKRRETLINVSDKNMKSELEKMNKER